MYRLLKHFPWMLLVQKRNEKTKQTVFLIFFFLQANPPPLFRRAGRCACLPDFALAACVYMGDTQAKRLGPALIFFFFFVSRCFLF